VTTQRSPRLAEFCVDSSTIPPVSRLSPTLRLLLALLLCLGAWYWLRAIFIPGNTAQAQAAGRPIGNNSDLYPRWLGTRELLLHGRDPYSADITREIQVGYYGRPLDSSRPSDPTDQAGFAYPVYVAFLLAPTVHLQFAAVNRAGGWALLALTALSIPLWLKALRFRAGCQTVLALTLLAFGTYALMQGYYLRQFSLLVAFLLAASAAAVVAGHLMLAGVLLAVASIKPQLSLALVLWLMIWVLGDWRKRQPLLWSFGLSLGALVLGGELVLPGWISRFVAAARAYQAYVGEPSILHELLGPTFGFITSLILIVAMVVVGWRWRREAAGSPKFGFCMSAALAAELLVIPKLSHYNQLLLFPALVVLWQMWHEQGKPPIAARVFGRAVFVCLAWEWLAALVLALASFFLPVSALYKISGLPLYSSYAVLPLTILALVAFGLRRVRRADC
jgi:hypothetical protein